MRFLNCYFQISVMLILATALACGNSRNGRVTGQRNKETGGVQSKMLNTFNAKITEIGTRSGKNSKPTPDSSVITFGRDILKAYEALAKADSTQGKKNENLESTFGNMNIIPDLDSSKEKLTLKAENDKGFLFAGEIDKKSRTGTLKAEKAPSDLATDTTSAVEPQEEAQEELDANGVRPKPKRAATKAKPAPVVKGPRFSATVNCFDTNCDFMVVSFIDTKVGAFYPVYVRSQLTPNNGSSLDVNVVNAPQVKKALVAKGITVTEGDGEKIKWLAEIPLSNFIVETQTRVSLANAYLSTYFKLRNADGSETTVDEKASDLVLSNSTLHDTVVTLNPKK